jgi:hypothetical protein
MERRFLASGEGMCGVDMRNSTVGESGGSRECSVGVNLRAWSFGVGDVWMKILRWWVGKFERRAGRSVAARNVNGRLVHR